MIFVAHPALPKPNLPSRKFVFLSFSVFRGLSSASGVPCYLQKTKRALMRSSLSQSTNHPRQHGVRPCPTFAPTYALGNVSTARFASTMLFGPLHVWPSLPAQCRITREEKKHKKHKKTSRNGGGPLLLHDAIGCLILKKEADRTGADRASLLERVSQLCRPRVKSKR